MVAIPSVAPPEVIHPNPVWLQLRTEAAESSEVVAHISNIEFVRWIDRAAECALSAAGWSYHDLLKSNLMFFVARHEIDYRQEVLADEDLLIATWVRDVRRVKSWRDTVIWRTTSSGPEVVCTASTLWVQVDLTTRRPRRMLADMIQRLQPLQHDAPPWRDRS